MINTSDFPLSLSSIFVKVFYGIIIISSIVPFTNCATGPTSYGGIQFNTTIVSPVNQYCSIPISVAVVLANGTTDSSYSGNVTLGGAIGNETFLFQDDFETALYYSHLYGGVSTISYDSTIVATSPRYSAKIVGGNQTELSGPYYDFGSDLQPVRFSLYMRSNTTTKVGPIVSLVQMRLVNFGSSSTVRMDGAVGRIRMKRCQSSSFSCDPLYSTGIPYNANQWYKVDVVINWNNLTADLWVDDVLIDKDFPLVFSDSSSVWGICYYNYDGGVTGWLDNVRVVLSESNLTSVSVTPSSINVVNGVWNGNVQVTQSASNMYLRATYANGTTAYKEGRSKIFNVSAAAYPSPSQSPTKSPSNSPSPSPSQSPSPVASPSPSASPVASASSSSVPSQSPSPVASSSPTSQSPSLVASPSSSPSSQSPSASSTPITSANPSQSASSSSPTSSPAASSSPTSTANPLQSPSATSSSTPSTSSANPSQSQSPVASSTATSAANPSQSQSATSSSTPSNSASPASGNNATKSKGNQGAFIGIIAGLSVGFVLVLAGAAAFVFIGIRRAKKQRQEPSEDKEDIELRPSSSSTPDSSVPTQYSSRTGYTTSSPTLYHSSNQYSASSPSRQSSSHSSVTPGSKKGWILDFREIKLESKIGAGAFGEVYKAKWRGIDVAGENEELKNNFYAVKKLIAVENQAQTKDFFAEAEVMKNLTPHLNITQLYGVCEEPLCIVTEFVSNGALLSKLQANSLDDATKVKVARGIAAGMMHLHSEGICHRDLAARNILLDSVMNPKVCDFGMSRIALDASGHRTNNTVGPIRWMAPEALTNQVYNTKTDVWSFGVTLYEILTHKMPYANLDLMMACGGVIAGTVSLVAEIEEHESSYPTVLVFVMKQCLQRDPQARPEFQQIVEWFDSS